MGLCTKTCGYGFEILKLDLLSFQGNPEKLASSLKELPKISTLVLAISIVEEKVEEEDGPHRLFLSGMQL